MKLFLTLSVICALLFQFHELQGQGIDNYQKYLAIAVPEPARRASIVLRKFTDSGTVKYLMVDPGNLATSIARGDAATVTPDSWENILKRFQDTPYIKAINESYKNADRIQDAGITHFSSIERGAALTVDLCPSKRPLDRVLFAKLIDEFGKEEKPVPVALSVTGVWINSHENDMKWLIGLAAKKYIAITWVNHSYNHKTRRGIPLRQNFLLEKGTDLNGEVLRTEIKMIQEGVVPSPFFRFPGLVSDREIFRKIIEFGLIPLGSDAWLGKNQWPKNGSIILLHGNGNEPVGIIRFFKLLADEQPDIRKKRWLLYDLRESVEDYEEAGTGGK